MRHACPVLMAGRNPYSGKRSALPCTQRCGVLCVMCALQIHLRHLVGGRARSYMGEIPNERMFQVGAVLQSCMLLQTQRC